MIPEIREKLQSLDSPEPQFSEDDLRRAVYILRLKDNPATRAEGVRRYIDWFMRQDVKLRTAAQNAYAAELRGG